MVTTLRSVQPWPFWCLPSIRLQYPHTYTLIAAGEQLPNLTSLQNPSIIIEKHVWFTLWLFNIAMENGPFIDALPINSMVILHGELLVITRW